MAETVLLGDIAQVFETGPKELVFAGALVGLLLVLPWWTTFEYSRFFYLLRLQQAKEFEPTVVCFLTEGNALANGEGKVRDLRIARFVRFMRPQRAGWFLMILFTLSFFAITLLKGMSFFGNRRTTGVGHKEGRILYNLTDPLQERLTPLAPLRGKALGFEKDKES